MDAGVVTSTRVMTTCKAEQVDNTMAGVTTAMTMVGESGDHGTITLTSLLHCSGGGGTTVGILETSHGCLHERASAMATGQRSAR